MFSGVQRKSPVNMTKPTKRETHCAVEQHERGYDHLHNIVVDVEFETSRGNGEQVCLLAVGFHVHSRAGSHDGGCPRAPQGRRPQWQHVEKMR